MKVWNKNKNIGNVPLSLLSFGDEQMSGTWELAPHTGSHQPPNTLKAKG